MRRRWAVIRRLEGDWKVVGLAWTFQGAQWKCDRLRHRSPRTIFYVTGNPDR